MKSWKLSSCERKWFNLKKIAWKKVIYRHQKRLFIASMCQKCANLSLMTLSLANCFAVERNFKGLCQKLSDMWPWVFCVTEISFFFDEKSLKAKNSILKIKFFNLTCTTSVKFL